MIDSRPISSIKVGERIRHDLGDLNALAQSITDNGGLLQPILIKSDGTLIAGERRLAACKAIGREHIEVNVRNDFASATALLIAERDENTCRKDFTPDEFVALGKRLEELERPAAEARKASTQAKPGEGRVGGGESPPPDKGKTRENVAAALGVGGKKYEHAKKVVEAAEAGNPVAEKARVEMNRTGKVEPAYRKVAGSAPLDTRDAADGRQMPATFFGKGDKWQEATEPLSRYLRGQRKRNFDYSHLNWKEAKKRVERIDSLMADLQAARDDLEPRSHKAKLSF